MQKLVKRTAEAQRAVARRTAKKTLNVYRRSKLERRSEQSQNVEEIAGDLRAARVARAEAWDLGPLTPRRDVDGNFTHGATLLSRNRPQTPFKAWEIEQRCAWAGGSKLLNIVKNDRVVVMEGPDKGKIDLINHIDLNNGVVELKTQKQRPANTDKYLTVVPDVHRKVDPSQPPTSAATGTLPISAIRLVHPLTDPVTGITRDVIVRSLTAGPVKRHRATGWKAWTRYITGLNVAVPWPEPCPLPDTLIDELRNKYSKFRTRHEVEYVQRKEAEASEKKAGRVTAASMLTPLQEFNRQQRDARRARGQPMLTEEMLEKVGQVIARNKAVALSAAGVSEVHETPAQLL
ncbi:KOW motif domain-containing protein [Verticillium alfalfae VaMs.102]|uniref:KOW motif domain-containing protein n=1 Tax=Verticillium alfalfae (strain VaMs.102 / ATCC MYA-4576 / FGSC 10136) TaxID=526221 RepID=C9SKE1_VERA1|nr:KOW motif domain-containing protein [Verticillium alfalfae VaMs.102]EEY19159.1 KOW motif domain-containing protein [Verticillium alfalfae VaMs.102]